MLIVIHYLVVLVLGGALYLVGMQTDAAISAAGGFGLGALAGLINSFIGYLLVGRPRLELRGLLTLAGVYLYLPIVFLMTFSLMMNTLQVVYQVKRASSGVLWPTMLSMGLGLLLLGVVAAQFSKERWVNRE